MDTAERVSRRPYGIHDLVFSTYADCVYRQSQRIQTSLLSRTASNDLVERKSDFVFSYSHLNQITSEIYNKLARIGLRDKLGHTTDSYTKRTALFSGIEVKPSDGGHAKAKLQLSVWLSASLRNKERLARMVTQELAIPNNGADENQRDVLPEPGITTVGHDHQVYYSYLNESGAIVSSPRLCPCLIACIDAEYSQFTWSSISSAPTIGLAVQLHGVVVEYLHC